MSPGAKVLTVSDSTYRGERDDRSGPALVGVLEANGFDVGERRVVPDGAESVAAAIKDLARGFAGAILTTGGTGFAPADQTPEGTQLVLERQAPGLAEAMRAVSPLGASVGERPERSGSASCSTCPVRRPGRLHASRR